ADNPLSYIEPLKTFLRKLVDPFQNPLFQGREVGSSIMGILAVDKGKIGLSIARRVEEGKLDVFSPIMDPLIEAVLLNLFVKEIEKAIFRADLLSVEIEGEPHV